MLPNQSDDSFKSRDKHVVLSRKPLVRSKTAPSRVCSLLETCNVSVECKPVSKVVSNLQNCNKPIFTSALQPVNVVNNFNSNCKSNCAHIVKY